MSTTVPPITQLQCLIFTIWLGIEIIGIAACLTGYTTAGWSILGVFTGLAVLGVLGILLYNIYSTYRMGEVKPPVTSVSVSASNFTSTLEQNAAV